MCGTDKVVGGGAVPFCIRLPDGYKQDGKPDKRDNWTSLDFKKPGAAVEVNTKWNDSTTGYDDLIGILNSEGSGDGNTLVASGATAGGAGKFVQYDRTPKASGKHQIRFEAIIKGPKMIIKCATSWWTDQPEGQSAADACKSLSPQ